MNQPHHSTQITIHLESPQELFDSISPGSLRPTTPHAANWDSVGATLGEPGTVRLLRLLHAHPSATELCISLPPHQPNPQHPADAPDHLRHTEQKLAEQKLTAWCHARIQSNRFAARQYRAAGLQLSLLCLILLATALIASAVLTNYSLFGTPTALRTLLSEALVIAGWVAMWRPIELLIFDPLKPLHEARMLSRITRISITHRPS
jgi:hypothetical protein